MQSFPLTVYHRLSPVIHADRGASAIEFALLAPVLVVALLGTVDVGRALTEQMTIGSLLRTVAQSVIAEGDISKVDQVRSAARGDDLVSVSPPICVCPDNTQAVVDCSATCAGPQPTAIYYSLVIQKTFSGIFLPDILLTRSLQVQVR